MNAKVERGAVVVVNLDSDGDRLARLTPDPALQNMRFIRVSAIRGASIARAVAGFIPGADTSRPGTLGCFLSHVRAWETILDEGLDGAIILEDDVILVRPLAECHALAKAQGVDMVFVNNRMALTQPSDEARADNEGFCSVVDAIMARKDLNQLACGFDGYYLSREGARRLIEVVASTGVSFDVDWFGLYACLGRSGLSHRQPHLSPQADADRIGTFYDLAAPVLTSAVMKVAAVLHSGVPSSRIREDKAAAAT